MSIWTWWSEKTDAIPTKSEPRLDLDGFGGANSKAEALTKISDLLATLRKESQDRMSERTLKVINDQVEFYKAAQKNKVQSDISEATPLYAIGNQYVAYTTSSYTPGSIYYAPESMIYSPPWRANSFISEGTKLEEPAPERIDPREQTQREILI